MKLEVSMPLCNVSFSEPGSLLDRRLSFPPLGPFVRLNGGRSGGASADPNLGAIEACGGVPVNFLNRLFGSPGLNRLSATHLLFGLSCVKGTCIMFS